MKVEETKTDFFLQGTSETISYMNVQDCGVLILQVWKTYSGQLGLAYPAGLHLRLKILGEWLEMERLA